MGKRICVLRMGFLWYLHTPVEALLSGLSARGHDVTLVKSYQRDRSKPEEPLPGIRNSMIALLTRRLPKSRFLEPLVFLEFVLQCVVRGLWARPDVVVAVDVDTLLPGFLISRLRRCRLAYYSLELYTERPNITGKRFWLWLEKRLINKAHFLVTCEPNRARVMHEKYGARDVPMCVLNVPLYTPPGRTDVLPRYLASKGVNARRIVLYQGGVDPARCMEEIVQAAALLDPGYAVVIVGRPSPNYDVEEAIRRHGAENRAFNYGSVQSTEELRNITLSADLGLQLQFNVGLNSFYCAPTKLFQYLMAGLPVIASKFPGMIEIIEGDEVGLCADPTSPSEIAAAINRILSDDSLHQRMVQNALRVAREKYCFEIEGAKLLDAIERL